ncbi:transglutaminase-like putative cysteine protease [Aliiruegeria haliotis]|uniref:Transglutaminase-like putative cysteine protease n=1 Tax=Aliiruegeria haliotis TaxID=1280846 RepID=A0A2T0RW78_9RHOB|nr:transglutaminase family protein [Aliiruegeria haliotis]PRY25382.1 transglutaminase-like putative cysteine protease [Aliiruegeria haliotis]
MRLKIQHRTTYTYSEPVAYGLQQLRLTPKSRHGQSVLTWQTQVEGGKIELEFDDQHANRVELMSFSGEGHDVVVSCQGEIETADTNGVVGKHAGFAPLWYFERQTPRTRQGAGIRSLVKGLNTEIDDPIARFHALSDRVREAVTYEAGKTDVTTTAEEALSIGAGVCQDHAHVFIAAARQLGLPARYVSGYLLMNDRVEQEASHGWAEVHIAPIGWIGFDVSNEICPDERYVRVATGLDYSEAAPIHGLHFGEADGESLGVDIQVQQQ